MSRPPATAAGRTVMPAGLAVVAFLLLAIAPDSAAGPGYAVLCLTLVAGWFADRPPALGTGVPPRVLLAAGVLVLAARESARAETAGGEATAPLVITGLLLLGLLLGEGLLQRVARPWFHTAHLSARPRPPASLVDNGAAWLVSSGAVALVGLVALAGGPGWLLPVPAAGAALSAGWLAADGWRRWRTAHRAELAPLTAALAHHRPRFLLYFSAPPGSAYQARMWLPYLARIGEPHLVVLPERYHLRPVAAATRAPVVVCETFEALDAVLVPSLRAAFYVNNGMKNAHCVRYRRLTHVQLYHGDSDKAVTASPLNALFDRVFVVGQAAIDRFVAHGVEIPRERFRIVGRPQAEQLQVTDRPIGEVADRTVLYAPTWVGAHRDSDYCSLPIAEPIVAALLARGATVILRPHPYAGRDRASAARLRRVARLLAADRARTGREHRWGRATTAALSLFECMNLSHAMICDVSGVASEFLYTGKPFAITDMVGAGARFTEAFPLARAGYAIRRDAGNLTEMLDDLLERDPLRQAREELRSYYLGDFPPDRYAEAFLTQARRCVSEPQREPRTGLASTEPASTDLASTA